MKIEKTDIGFGRQSWTLDVEDFENAQQFFDALLELKNSGEDLSLWKKNFQEGNEWNYDPTYQEFERRVDTNEKKD